MMFCNMFTIQELYKLEGQGLIVFNIRNQLIPDGASQTLLDSMFHTYTVTRS